MTPETWRPMAACDEKNKFQLREIGHARLQGLHPRSGMGLKQHHRSRRRCRSQPDGQDVQPRHPKDTMPRTRCHGPPRDHHTDWTL